MNDGKNDDKRYGNVVNIQKIDPTQFEKEQMPYALICTKVIQNIKNPMAYLIWSYLQSMPPTWKPNKYQLMEHFDISEASYKRHMAYLSKCCLIEHHQERGIKGRMMPAKLIVLNGSKYNECGDNYRGIIFDTADEPAPALDSDRGINLPPTGVAAIAVNELHINTITSIKAISHTQEEFFLEQNLFSDSEQQRKAIVMRKLCLDDEKSKSKHASLKTDKTFIEVLDECVSHYATQQQPQLVSPQRLQSWINREARFQTQQSFAKPANKYPTKEERAVNYEKTSALEREAEKRKKEEIENSKGGITKLTKNVDLKALRAAQEAEMKKLGMTPSQYHDHITKGKGI